MQMILSCGKKSKQGEPYWDSPWGRGRPGWHIECSVMASDTIKHLAGGKIDIHTGGIDLRFPHHDNEIAQCEAYFDFPQWVNYFIHTGHLNIQGLKMSKSLKNFVKIQEALMDNTPRQLRFLFLLHKYNVPMDYNDNSMNEAVAMEKFFNEFFMNIKATLRTLPLSGPQKWTDAEKQLESFILNIKHQVHETMCDDLNTPVVLSHLQDLAKEMNRYLTKSSHVSMILRSGAEYMTHIFDVFGLIHPISDIGFPLETTGSSGQDREATLTPLLNVFSTFRDDIRAAARQGNVQAVLNLCDQVRDEALPPLGIRLEDRANEGAVWKLTDKQLLIEEKRKKEAEQQLKIAKKQQAEKERALKDAALAEKAKMPPSEMFRAMTEKFSQFDLAGIPTHDAAKEPISKARTKKLKKEQEKQAKLYAKFNAE